jgi:myosin heavy subunit
MSQRQKKAALNTPKKVENAKVAKVKKVNIDIVTGKPLASVFFDPSKAVDCSNTDYDWIGENLYVPACVVKEETGLLTVSLPSGEVYRMTSACRVTDRDDEGVDDILKLRDFSEMSLIHTLRVRYYKDEVYTFVGPILISLNPYKRIKDIYQPDTMDAYHGQKQVRLHRASLHSC